MEQLNPLDAQFLGAEDAEPQVSMAIGCICVFEAPAPAYSEFVDAVAARLPEAPAYRRKLRQVPLGLGPPAWADASDLDLGYHLRQAALPAPGGDDQLAALMAEVMGQRLDRDYPLWRSWLVDGLSGGRWAIIATVHHAMADGLSGIGLAELLLDPGPAPLPAPAPADGATPDPSGLALASQAALGLLTLPARSAAALGGALTHPAAALAQTGATALAAARLALGAGRPAAGSTLRGPIGHARRYAWARTSLADIKTVKNALGGTVNDVMLAAVAGGYRDLLLSRGEVPAPHMVPSLIPVSVRAPADGSYHNQFSLLVTDLPVHVPDPAGRLTAIRSQLSGLKAGHVALAARALVSLGDLVPYPLAARAVRAGYRLPQRQIVTVTTSLPGPRTPLFCLGRRMTGLLPYVPIADMLRTGVAVLSYCDEVIFAVTGDYATTPDIGVLTDGISRGVTDLLAAAT